MLESVPVCVVQIYEWGKRTFISIPLIHLFLWGVFGGIPLLLTGSTLSLWFREEGVSLAALGAVSLIHLPYALKFLWASWFESNPPLFFQSRWGNRKGWILLCQLAVLGGMLGVTLGVLKMGSPFFIPGMLWIVWWAATHDLLMQASQRDMLHANLWGYGEACGVLGYRLGILLGGAGALYLSSLYPWPVVWGWMALVCGCLFGATLLMPFKERQPVSLSVDFRWIDPFKAFFNETPWKALLAFMVLYRLQDYLLGFFPQFFYLELGFTKAQLALGYKVFGVVTLTLGGVLGGYWIRTKGYAFTLMAGLVLHMVSNVGFLIQACGGAQLPLLYGTVALEEMTKGIAITAFFSYQLLCCRSTHVVTRLAILIAFTTLSQSLLGSVSGVLVETLGWPLFFCITSLAGFPAFFMLWTNRVPYVQSAPGFSSDFVKAWR